MVGERVYSEEELRGTKVKVLKQILNERQQSIIDCIEKGDFVKKILETNPSPTKPSTSEEKAKDDKPKKKKKKPKPNSGARRANRLNDQKQGYMDFLLNHPLVKEAQQQFHAGRITMEELNSKYAEVVKDINGSCSTADLGEMFQMGGKQDQSPAETQAIQREATEVINGLKRIVEAKTRVSNTTAAKAVAKCVNVCIQEQSMHALYHIGGDGGAFPRLQAIACGSPFAYSSEVRELALFGMAEMCMNEVVAQKCIGNNVVWVFLHFLMPDADFPDSIFNELELKGVTYPMRLIASKALADLIRYCSYVELGALGREDVSRFLVGTVSVKKVKIAICLTGSIGSMPYTPIEISMRLLAMLASLPPTRPVLLKCGLREKLQALAKLSSLPVAVATIVAAINRSLDGPLTPMIAEEHRTPVKLDGSGWESSQANQEKYARLKKCAWCLTLQSELAAAMKKCGKCKVPYYCSSECQTKHWKGGHKMLCQATQR